MRNRSRMVVAALVAVALVIGLWWLATRNPGSAPAGTTTVTTSATKAPGQTSTRQSTAPVTRTSTRAKVTPASGATDPASGLPTVALAQLPAEASDTMAAIRKGPPFPIRKDGTVFGNNERLLPRQPSGYYHEFTVVTPGESDRGARRIITGGPNYGVTNGEFYYTDDHYASFERITS